MQKFLDKNKYSIFCIVLTALFWIIEVSVLGYAVYFLNENGYAASEIAILMAVTGIVAAVTQPFIGYYADSNKKIDFKNILYVFGVIVILLFLGLLYFDKNKLVAGILFSAIYVFTNGMSPFVNSSCFYYKDRGMDVDYGVVRGFGSFSFAVFSYVLGSTTKLFGSKAVAINGIVSAILFLLVAIIIPRVKDYKESNVTIEMKAKSSIEKNDTSFIMKYKAFTLILISTVLAICFQNADCGYLIQMITELGGDSYNLGVANAIAAIVEIPIMFYISKLMKKISLSKLILIATFFYVLRGFVFTIPSMIALYMAQMMQMLTYAIIIPSTVYLSDEMMHEGDKNKGQTFVGLAVTMGFITGSFIGGQFIAIGGTSLLKVGCIVIAILSFIFAALGHIVYAKTHK